MFNLYAPEVPNSVGSNHVISPAAAKNVGRAPKFTGSGKLNNNSNFNSASTRQPCDASCEDKEPRDNSIRRIHPLTSQSPRPTAPWKTLLCDHQCTHPDLTSLRTNLTCPLSERAGCTESNNPAQLLDRNFVSLGWNPPSLETRWYRTGMKRVDDPFSDRRLFLRVSSQLSVNSRH